MKTKHLPTSRAKTAYGLLSEICALATEEPKRIAMGIWSTDDGDMPPAGVRPACGTVGCIGGWTRTLRPGRDTASETLGLDGRQIDELFYDDRLCSSPRQQTRRHARDVVRHIRAFQAKYRSQLLAKKV